MVNIVLAVMSVALAGIYWLGIAAIPKMRISDSVGPTAYPTLLLIVLLIVAVLLLVEGLKKKDFAPALASVKNFLREEGLVFFVSAAAILGYFVLFEPLGYVLSTLLFLLGAMFLLHKGRRWVAVVVAIAFTAITQILFVNIFGTQLPAGLLSF